MRPSPPALVRTSGSIGRGEKSGRSIVYRLKMSVLEDALLSFAQTFGWDMRARGVSRRAAQPLRKPRPLKGEA